MKTKTLISALAALGAAACVHAGSGNGVVVCGENPAPTERRVFIALPDPGVQPGAMPFVDKPVVQACETDTIAWYGPDEFTIEFDAATGSPLERAAEQAQAIDFPSNGKGKVKLKVRKNAEKDKPYKYSVIVPGHAPLDPQVIIRR